MYSMYCLFLNNKVFALRSLCVSDDDCDDDLDDHMFLCNAKARIIIIIINPLNETHNG